MSEPVTAKRVPRVQAPSGTEKLRRKGMRVVRTKVIAEIFSSSMRYFANDFPHVYGFCHEPVTPGWTGEGRDVEVEWIQ